MIAEVFITKGPAGPMPPDGLRFAEEVTADARNQNGVEANISVADPDTGESVSMTLFRDQAALDAYQAYAKEKIAEAQGMGTDVELISSRVYSQVIAAL